MSLFPRFKYVNDVRLDKSFATTVVSLPEMILRDVKVELRHERSGIEDISDEWNMMFSTGAPQKAPTSMTAFSRIK